MKSRLQDEDPVDAALKALAEPRRREILRLVWDRELASGEIAQQFEISAPAISQHLRVLKEADLVDERREGTRRLYRARPEIVRDVRRFLDEYWTDGLERLRDVAEAAERDQRRRRPGGASGDRPRERTTHDRGNSEPTGGGR